MSPRRNRPREVRCAHDSGAIPDLTGGPSWANRRHAVTAPIDTPVRDRALHKIGWSLGISELRSETPPHRPSWNIGGSHAPTETKNAARLNRAQAAAYQPREGESKSR